MTLCLPNMTDPVSALAAEPATFPLNDVDFASSGTWPLLAANFAFPDTHASPSATVAQHARLMANWWSQSGSNRRPDACKATALPAELWPQSRVRTDRQRIWWAWDDSNVRPHPYQGCALTT